MSELVRLRGKIYFTKCILCIGYSKFTSNEIMGKCFMIQKQLQMESWNWMNL